MRSRAFQLRPCLGGRDFPVFPAAFHSGPPPCTLPPRVSSLAPVHLPSLWALGPLSLQPRAPAWLTPCSRPTLGYTTMQVSLGTARPGGVWVCGVKEPRKRTGRFVGGLALFQGVNPFHPVHPQTPATCLGITVMLNWVESLRAIQADGDLFGKWLLGVTAYSHLCLQQPIPRPMPQ